MNKNANSLKKITPKKRGMSSHERRKYAQVNKDSEQAPIKSGVVESGLDSEESMSSVLEKRLIKSEVPVTRKRKLFSSLNTIAGGNRIVTKRIGSLLDESKYEEDVLKMRAAMQKGIVAIK